jgi:hypothetical protein
MSCTKEVLGVRFAHHSWRRGVSWSEYRSDRDTDMWGRPVINEHVICHKQDVCEACGQVREGVDCLCDPSRAECCAIRLAWLDRTHEATA